MISRKNQEKNWGLVERGETSGENERDVGRKERKGRKQLNERSPKWLVRIKQLKRTQQME